MGLIGCPDASVRNYYCWLRNDPEERSSVGEKIAKLEIVAHTGQYNLKGTMV